MQRVEFTLAGTPLIWVLDRRTRLNVEMALRTPWSKLMASLAFAQTTIEQLLYSGVRDAEGNSLAESVLDSLATKDPDGFAEFATKVVDSFKTGESDAPFQEPKPDTNSGDGSASGLSPMPTGRKRTGKSKTS